MLMPQHRCPRCRQLVTGRCPCGAVARDHARPNAAARGYCNVRWRRFRDHQLALQPLCVLCERAGRVQLATCVDHIVPVEGPTDPRFLDARAVQSLCTPCHSKKTATEDSAFARRAT